MKNILITGIGGGGSNNLYESLRISNLDHEKFKFFGSNVDEKIIAKSPLEDNILLPLATAPNYKEQLIKAIGDLKIDLIIPNNDREVGVISEIRDSLNCKVFLPDHETVVACQDKHKMYQKLEEFGILMAKSFAINSLSEIDSIMDKLPGDKYWVRPRIGSGSKGATWVKTAQQAKEWIQLWVELRGFKVEDFTISEFLPGRDYCFQSVWKDGELVLAKMCERLSYFGGENRLSGMSSTPAVAKTILDPSALETIFKTVSKLTSHPHGNFNFDLKGNIDGEMCITECNVGRFCMITPIFDRTGKHSTAEYYVRSAFNEIEDNIILDPIDIEENCYLLRELDTLPLIVKADQLSSKIKFNYETE